MKTDYDKNEFTKLIKEICSYYGDHGWKMGPLAKEIGLNDRRSLQYWKSGDRFPSRYTFAKLVEFLENNNGGQFNVRMKSILGSYYFENIETQRGKFPKGISDDDIKIIRLCFPGPDELTFLCAMIVHGNKSIAAAETLPNGTLVQKAALISSYETYMDKAKKVFGIDGIYDWQNKIIQYMGIGQIPEEVGDLEALGQPALDSIIYCYLSTKGAIV